MMNGDSQGLVEIARTEKDPKVREKAIGTIGMVGDQDEHDGCSDDHLQLAI